MVRMPENQITRGVIIMKQSSLAILSICILTVFSCESPTDSDTTPPQISLSSPINGATVSDTTTIKALVADNEGVKSVEFYLDGNLLATVTNEPFETHWNTKESNNGNHTLQCKAIDESDNETLSESITVTVSNVLFSINFTGDWLQPGVEGILFFSGPNGEALYDTTWSGNTTINVMPTESITEFPNRVSVTTVKPANWNSEIILIGTNYNEEPDTWTYKNKYKYKTGEATLNFINIPNHEGYIVCSQYEWGNQSNSGTLPNQVTIPLHLSPAKVYIQLKNTDQGVLYKWVENIEGGGTYDIDLSAMDIASSKDINIPNAVGTGYRFNLQGFEEPGVRHSWDYYIYRNQDYSSLPNTITAYYPGNTIIDFRTRIYIYENEDRTNWWYSNYVGNIPDNIDVIDAEFDFVTISPNYVQIQPSGTFTGMTTLWEYTDPNEIKYQWDIYGGADDYSVILPELPESFTNLYPGITKEDFQLIGASLYFHEGFDSQHDIIDLIFKSETFFWEAVAKSLRYIKGNPNL